MNASIYLKVRAFLRLILFTLLLGFNVCEESPTSIETPKAPSVVKKINKIIEWPAENPELKQYGNFTYDDSGKLLKYEFGLDFSKPTLKVDYYYDSSERLDYYET